MKKEAKHIRVHDCRQYKCVCVCVFANETYTTRPRRQSVFHRTDASFVIEGMVGGELAQEHEMYSYTSDDIESYLKSIMCGSGLWMA